MLRRSAERWAPAILQRCYHQLLTKLKLHCKFMNMKLRRQMTRMSTLITHLRRSLGGSPAGSAAFYGVVAVARVAGLPTYAESRRDYKHMISSRTI